MAIVVHSEDADVRAVVLLVARRALSTVLMMDQIGAGIGAASSVLGPIVELSVAASVAVAVGVVVTRHAHRAQGLGTISRT